jgi:hypothetical protein
VADQVLTQRHLNRALLARQHLLERVSLPLERVLEDVAGLQTQYAPAGYIGLWSRMAGFERPMLTEALEARRVIQATLMRSTIHMVSAADYWPMLIGVSRARREWWLRVARRQLEGIDLDAVAAAIIEELSGGPIRQKELDERLKRRGIDASSAATHLLVDVVRVPPSGTWDRRRADLFALAKAWVKRPRGVTERSGLELLIRRYFGAFGPASLSEVANWIGINIGEVKKAAEGMELRTFRDDEGRPLLDLPDGPLPDADTPAPARLLPVWDSTLLVHARRTQILPERHRGRVFNTRTPHSVNTFLLDGQVAGTWRHEGDQIRLEPFGRLSAADRRQLEEEAHSLARLVRVA